MDTRPRVFHKYGADNQIRTDDLVITNDVLYLLSYISEASYIISPPVPIWEQAEYGADNQIRTDDLVITNDVLYLLSYISIRPCLRLAYYTIVRRVCQGHFRNLFLYFFSGLLSFGNSHHCQRFGIAL